MAGPDNNMLGHPEALSVSAFMAGTGEFMGGLEVMPENGRYVMAGEALAQLLRKTGGPSNIALEFELPAINLPPTDPYSIASGRVVVDDRNHTVYVDERLVDLSAKEYGLLAYLAHPARVDIAQSKEQLLRDVWGYSNASIPLSAETTVRIHAWKVRRILGPELGDIKHGALRTVAMVGYYAVSDLS